MNPNNTLSVILAGGKGTRLESLTRDRAKPAVPFGGNYRIIDFALSNCLNSGLRKIQLFTQYKAASLDRHINLGWQHFFCRELGEFIDVIPPQQRIDENWYQGTADAVYQNIYSLESIGPDLVLILAGDHIYKMNYRRMIEFHVENKADLTIAALPVDRESARSFGVLETDDRDRITSFIEKPDRPVCGSDGKCLASMGIYVFTADYLFEKLLADANDPASAHDFGRNIIPSAVGTDRVMAFPFVDENRKTSSYWRDVGTIDSYFDANMDLVSVDPKLNIYDRQWPIRTWQGNYPPAKFVFADRNDSDNSRVGHAVDSIVCAGSIVSGGTVERSIVGPNSRINSWSSVTDSILFEGVEVGRHSRIRRAIIDKNVRIPEYSRIGIDPDEDRQNGYTISEGGVVVIGKGTVIPLQKKQVPAPGFVRLSPQTRTHPDHPNR